MEILITGANRGLGFELAAEAAARGHHVWAGVRSPGSPAEQLRALQEKYPGGISVLPLDVTNEQAIAYVRQQVSGRIDALDVVINNAAVLLGREQKLEELDFGHVEESFHTNLYGPVLVMKHFLPLLRKGSRQAIINISSEAGSMANAWAGDYSYGLTKAALNMFTAQLRSELVPLGFAVYAVHPGWIRTDMGGAQATGDAAESARSIMDLAERKVVPEDGAWFVDKKGNPMKL